MLLGLQCSHQQLEAALHLHVLNWAVEVLTDTWGMLLHTTTHEETCADFMMQTHAELSHPSSRQSRHFYF